MASRAKRKKTGMLQRPDVQRDMLQIVVKIRVRSAAAGYGPSRPIQRGIDDVALLRIHRAGEGARPIFSRDDVACNELPDVEAGRSYRRRAGSVEVTRIIYSRDSSPSPSARSRSSSTTSSRGARRRASRSRSRSWDHRRKYPPLAEDYYRPRKGEIRRRRSRDRPSGRRSRSASPPERRRRSRSRRRGSRSPRRSRRRSGGRSGESMGYGEEMMQPKMAPYPPAAYMEAPPEMWYSGPFLPYPARPVFHPAAAVGPFGQRMFFPHPGGRFYQPYRPHHPLPNYNSLRSLPQAQQRKPATITAPPTVRLAEQQQNGEPSSAAGGGGGGGGDPEDAEQQPDGPDQDKVE